MDKIKLGFEKFSEAWTACFLCMVQGDLSVVTLQHAFVASKVGIITAFAFLVASIISFKSKWIAIWLTGLFTTIADLLVHPSQFGGEFGESLVTGIIAMGIAFAYEHMKGKMSH